MPQRESVGRIWGFLLDGVRFISGSASPAGLLFLSLLFGIFLLKWYLHADIHMRVREHLHMSEKPVERSWKAQKSFTKEREKKMKGKKMEYFRLPWQVGFWWLKTLLPKEIIPKW